MSRYQDNPEFREKWKNKAWARNRKKAVDAGKDVPKFIKFYKSTVVLANDNERRFIPMEKHGELMKAIAAFLNSGGEDLYGGKNDIVVP